MKGRAHDAAETTFINHLIEAFTAMKSKITKDVRANHTRAHACFFVVSSSSFQAAEASRPVLAKVAAKCFKGADDQDRAGEATRETSKNFNKARCM